MNTSFNNDDDSFDDEDGDDDFDNEDGDSDNEFDGVKDSDEDGFSDAYEEFIGSDPQDPTDLPFYPYEDLTETYPKKIKTKTMPTAGEKNQQPIRLARSSPTRNKCLIFLIIFMVFLILTPFLFFIILS
ncbi:MAG: hypothetical protein HWN79_06555 [Candidatus Lokiarchaeota archaeon]|nr:hypothetical protein [Candidatus Lokiarchaeota archaeon]